MQRALEVRGRQPLTYGEALRQYFRAQVIKRYDLAISLENLTVGNDIFDTVDHLHTVNQFGSEFLEGLIGVCRYVKAVYGVELDCGKAMGRSNLIYVVADF